MKTKIFLGLTLCLLFSSCIKDYIGHGKDKVELKADNYLYEGNLEKIFLTEKIETIDIKIEDLENVGINDPNYNDAQAEIAALTIVRDESKQQISFILGLEQVSKDFPIPCDGFPIGKCVPVRLEYFVFSKFFKEALLVITDSKGTRASDNLEDLPGFENELHYIGVPVFDDGNGISVKILKRDIDGVESAYELFISNK